ELNKDRAVYFGDWALMTQDFLGNPYVFNQQEKIVWPITQAPSDAHVDQMLKSWCDHYEKDIDHLTQFGVNKSSVAQGYCMQDKQLDLERQLHNNQLYDFEYYRALKRKESKTMQFICTREHLY
ncbi:MAG: hypothetical protein ACRCXK_03010, partial [Wohlfahrtiimonas sp.]